MAEESTASGRKIIHIDMDAFFASVEQRDDPRLRGKPVAVGGSARRGVVAAASYEARQFGVRSAMPSVTAVRRCPALIFVKPRFDVYRAISHQIREIFRRHTDLVEPLSLDEAYLDVTRDRQGIGSAVRIAKMIRSAIREETGLTASAGVSYNKFLAKIASDQNKPDGMFVIQPHEGAGFVASLPLRRFYGVGPRTAERMESLGIHTGADLCDKGMDFMVGQFGKSAEYLYWAARGIDNRPVRPNRTRKSVGGERTFSEDLHSEDELGEALERIIDIVWKRIEDSNFTGRTLTLKVRYADFRLITRRRSSARCFVDKAEFAATARDLLAQLLPAALGVRLLGLTLSGLGDSRSQEVTEPGQRNRAAQRAFDF